MPPPPPQGRHQRLPPILRITDPIPTTAYSKAPRGLFVLPRVGRIFTASSISPSPSLRQRSSRYAIRAGRNLPDKEFRYLRHGCYSTPEGVKAWSFRFCHALHVAVQIGPSHPPGAEVWRMASEDSTFRRTWPFLLIVRTRQIVTRSEESTYCEILGCSSI